MTDLAKAMLRSKRVSEPASTSPRRTGSGGSASERPDNFVPGELQCHFNPTTLRLTYNNQFGDGRPFSHARETVAKLDVELVFDNSGIGYSVLDELATLTEMTRSDAEPPTAPSSNSPPPPSGRVPVVEFHWAGKLFEGVIESMTQTIEYWTREGIPLRATVQLSMKETARAEYDRFMHTTDPAAPPPFVPSVPADPAGKGSTDTATKGGNPRAGSAIAALNGLESMRGGAGLGAGASAGGSIGVSASVNLGAAAGFAASGGVSAGAGAGASAGFGLGASAGASASAGLGAAAGVGMAGGASIGGGIGGGIGAGGGIGFGVGAGIGASAGAGFGAGASASAGAFAGASASVSAGAFAGAPASAGVSASAGAFAGLGSSKRMTGNTGIDPMRLIPTAPPAPIGGRAQFDSTGRLVSDGSGTVAAGYIKIG